MKKSMCLAASLLALNLTPVFGQPTPPLPVQTQPRYAPPGVPPQPSDNFQQRLHEILNRANPPQNEAPALTKFNLDFPGGTPKELVAAIEKAMGRPLNAIIPDEDAATKLPTLKLNGITFPQLSDTLMIGSKKNETYRISPTYSQGWETGYYFKTTDKNPTDESVWFFYATKLPQTPVEKVCQFYSLSPFLDRGFTVDDITTAIQTGWKMSGETTTPELNYHKETKLLIAFGEPDKLKTIADVLKTLPPSAMTAYAAIEYQKAIEKLQSQIDKLNKQPNPPLQPVPGFHTLSEAQEKSGK